MTGRKFGQLTVLRRHPENARGGKARWACLCACGRETVIVGGSLRSGLSSTCGCSHDNRILAGSPWDLSGQRYGRLTVIRRHQQNTTAGKARWVCQCDCGQQTISVSGSLKSGHKSSCGCARREHLAGGASSRTHGLSGTPEHARWKAMIKRCHNPNDSSYSRYGGRGITVCSRWRESFVDFLADMGPIPSSRHSIERRDNDGGYSPPNCYWATALEQSRNTRRTLRVEYQGQVLPLTVWCERLGLKYSLVYNRIHAYGWTVDHAFTTPRGGGRAS